MKRIGSALLCVLGIGMFGEVWGEDRRPYEFREANRTIVVYGNLGYRWFAVEGERFDV